jgi:hypothetical protein
MTAVRFVALLVAYSIITVTLVTCFSEDIQLQQSIMEREGVQKRQASEDMSQPAEMMLDRDGALELITQLMQELGNNQSRPAIGDVILKLTQVMGVVQSELSALEMGGNDVQTQISMLAQNVNATLSQIMEIERGLSGKKLKVNTNFLSIRGLVTIHTVRATALSQLHL